jgi:polyferredoxin
MPLVDQDEEHLKILSIAYYVQAGMGALMGLFAILYIVLGLVLALNPIPASKPGDLPPTFPGTVFAMLGGIFLILAGAFAVSQFMAAKFLRHHQCIFSA